MSNDISNETSSGDQSEECSEIEECTNNYLSACKELSDHLNNIPSNMNCWMKDGKEGICNRMKDLLADSKIKEKAKNTYSVGRLPTHESEEQEPSGEENKEMISEMDNINVSGKKENFERKIKHIPPFFTMVNCDESGDTKYKEMCRVPHNAKQYGSLLCLDEKIKRRNGLLNQFGSPDVTNLS